MEFRDSSGQLIRTRSIPLFTTPQAEGAAMKTLIDTGFETIKVEGIMTTTRTQPSRARIEALYRQGLLWCTECHKNLTPRELWIPDDMHDGRQLCLDCAPDDALRWNDLCI